MNNRDINTFNALINGFFPNMVENFEEIIQEFEQSLPKQNTSGHPITNIWSSQKEKCFCLEMAVIGFNEDVIKNGITFDTSTNTLSIIIKEDKKNTEENDRHYYIRRISKRNIEKHYSFPNEFEFDSLDVSVENGLLTIILNEKKVEPRDIKINFLNNKQIEEKKSEV